MCDLLLFFGIASTQDEFVLFDKTARAVLAEAVEAAAWMTTA